MCFLIMLQLKCLPNRIHGRLILQFNDNNIFFSSFECQLSIEFHNQEYKHSYKLIKLQNALMSA